MARQYKIGELARLYHLDPDTLRYYEEQGLLHPGRAANGYRMFGPQDVWRLNILREMRGLGVPLARVRPYLEGQDAKLALRRMEEELRLLTLRQEEIGRAIQSLAERCRALEAALRRPAGEVFLQELGPRRVHVLPWGAHGAEEFDLLLYRLAQQLQEAGSGPGCAFGNAETGALLSLAAAKQGHCQEYEGVFAVHPRGEAEIEGGRYLCLCCRGGREKNSSHVPRLLETAGQQGWYPAGPLLQMIRTDLLVSSGSEDCVTELQLRVVPDARAGLCKAGRPAGGGA